LRFSARVLFSGRTVLAPGAGLRLDQLGLAEDLAWTLFGPLAAREIGDAQEVDARTDRAAAVLDDVMARSWVLLNRAPTFMPTALIAFRPVRILGRVIRLHPLACPAMNADYDGDQAAIFLPLTEEGQREAADIFSVVGHLRRDPSLLKWFSPNQDMLWGLAAWSMTPAGRKELADILAPEGYVTRDSLNTALQMMLQRDGVEATLALVQQLMDRGLELVHSSGASMSPFFGKDLTVPTPEQDTMEGWQRSAEEMTERLAACTDYTGNIGPQLLAVKTGARGSLQHIQWITGPRGTVTDVSGQEVIVRHGYQEGLSPEELFACVFGARLGLMRLARETYQMAYGVREPSAPKGYTVLARAMRAEHPGIVFAHAAATGEVDPLIDPDSRLFVGLPVK
jgi:DNA-directed RNA polymerase beta' subunit